MAGSTLRGELVRIALDIVLRMKSRKLWSATMKNGEALRYPIDGQDDGETARRARNGSWAHARGLEYLSQGPTSTCRSSS